mmetsp:Transcript_46/g.112  ORF Transcript_46/g.112 Transcript_46/m.112 type:complete len:211 (-) Transcript_46:476-1108(-)
MLWSVQQATSLHRGDKGAYGAVGAVIGHGKDLAQPEVVRVSYLKVVLPPLAGVLVETPVSVTLSGLLAPYLVLDVLLDEALCELRHHLQPDIHKASRHFGLRPGPCQLHTHRPLAGPKHLSPFEPMCSDKDRTAVRKVHGGHKAHTCRNGEKASDRCRLGLIRILDQLDEEVLVESRLHCCWYWSRAKTLLLKLNMQDDGCSAPLLRAVT